LKFISRKIRPKFFVLNREEKLVMKNSFFILILLLGYFKLEAQNSIHGKVIDATNGEALIGVNIYAPLLQIGTSTDKEGRFSLQLPEGEYTIRVSYIGYATQTISSQNINDTILKLSPQIDLEEVVIKAFMAQPNAPVSQKTLTAKDIEQVYVGQDPTFLLEKTTPSIISFSENGTGFSNYSQFRLRGIDQTRVNITLNGVPLNDMIDQGVFFSELPDGSA
jgi:iron complex outermembrane receptor protein